MMKKLLLSIMLVIGLSSINAQTNPHFGGGTGTFSSPYQISLPEHIDNLRHYGGRDYQDTYFILMGNIDLTNYITLNYPIVGWLPICGEYTGSSFFGNINGNGYTISGLWINRTDRNNVGLIGTFSGRIKDLSIITNPFGVKGGRNVGILVGNLCENGNVISCSSNGKVEGIGEVGGLIGSISHIYRSGGDYTSAAYVYQSYSNASVMGHVSLGGLIGWITAERGSFIKVQECYATGDIEGDIRDQYLAKIGLGGFVGSVYDIKSRDGLGVLIQDCYSHGRVFGENHNSLGGFAGWVIGSIFRNCYATGFVYGNERLGTFAGEVKDRPIFLDCYYDNSVNLDMNPTGFRFTQWQFPVEFFYGKSASEMKNSNTFINWDFNETWKVITNCTYPYFKWQSPTPPCVRTLITKSDTKTMSNNMAENNEELTLKIYPNPTTGIVNIETNIENPDIRVFDPRGVQIKEANSTSVDLSSYPKGVYIFYINGNMEKVIKQ